MGCSFIIIGSCVPLHSSHYPHQPGVDIVTFFGASIADADLIMPDGKSLEHEGGMPDRLILPAAADIASQRDPVLAHAAELIGVEITPAKSESTEQRWPTVFISAHGRPSIISTVYGRLSRF